MKKIKKALPVVIFTITLTSCYNSEFEDAVFRNTNDPFYDLPVADSLSKEHTIYLSWKEDDAADSFRLMRSADSIVPYWECIYEGNETTYTDTELFDNEKFIYRLDKTRGEENFKGKKYGFGWSSGSTRDEYEPNDGRETATFLEYDRICNLPCVSFNNDSEEVIDEDWFYVTIPPMRQADIIVGQHNLNNASVGAKTDLKIQVYGQVDQPVKHQVATSIINTGYETKTFYFKVFPEKTALNGANNYCTIIEYTVSLNQITKYN